jgi:hypothetical protein
MLNNAAGLPGVGMSSSQNQMPQHPFGMTAPTPGQAQGAVQQFQNQGGLGGMFGRMQGQMPQVGMPQQPNYPLSNPAPGQMPGQQMRMGGGIPSAQDNMRTMQGMMSNPAMMRQQQAMAY